MKKRADNIQLLLRAVNNQCLSLICNALLHYCFAPVCKHHCPLTDTHCTTTLLHYYCETQCNAINIIKILKICAAQLKYECGAFLLYQTFSGAKFWECVQTLLKYVHMVLFQNSLLCSPTSASITYITYKKQKHNPKYAESEQILRSCASTKFANNIDSDEYLTEAHWTWRGRE